MQLAVWEYLIRYLNVDEKYALFTIIPEAAEVEVAEKLWKLEREQENSSDGPAPPAATKRKLDGSQDELVNESQNTKRRASFSIDDENAKASGTLPCPTESVTESTDAANCGPPAAMLRMTVTSGFYVRSLCHDLGEAVGSQAIMAELIRTRQGQFELGKNVLDYEDLAKGEEVWGPQVSKMLEEWSGEYRPFAGSNSETNNGDQENLASSTEPVVDSVKEVESKVETKVAIAQDAA